METHQSESLLEKHTTIKIERNTVEDTTFAQKSDEDCCSCDELSYADAVFGCAVVAPLVVACWRGTWGIMDIHSELFPELQQFILGIIIHVSFVLVRVQLLARATGAWSMHRSRLLWVRERLLSRVYTYVFLLACIMHWRGGWWLLDMLVNKILPNQSDPHRPVLYACVTLLCYVIACCLRSSRNFLASPYFLTMDGKEPTYLFTTRYEATSSKETALYILDCVFSVGVVGSLVVFVWRGSWALLDMWLYPEEPTRSCWISLCIGYALVVVTFALQAPMRWIAARLHGAPRLLLADVYHFMSFLATVNVWRGIWGLINAYLFPDSPKLSNWCSHVVSITLLILLNCSNSVIVRGVYIDAEEPAGECVVFPCHYLRLYFHKERTKKRHKRALAAAAVANKRPDESSVPLQIPDGKV